jgi:class 3 adenylate cyclase
VKAAAPGEVVVTEAVAEELSSVAWLLRPLEPATLRGIATPVRSFVVAPR